MATGRTAGARPLPAASGLSFCKPAAPRLLLSWPQLLRDTLTQRWILQGNEVWYSIGVNLMLNLF